MNVFYQLGKDEPVVRLLQITDPHLFSEPSTCLLGVNTHQSLQAVLAEVQKTNVNFHAILATGDLIQDHQIQGYHHFARMIEPFKKPVFWVEGNHDEQPQMSLCLSEYPYIQPEKQIFAGNYWQILMLNSQVAGAPSGYLSRGQLAWLEKSLSENTERFSLIVLHHNILPTHSAWLDQHSLKNADKLAEILARFPKVKAILHGHIHQEVNAIWQNIQILATPSTCIQFKPNCDEFTLDILPQGWREISLFEDGRIETEVKRLKSNDFLPNLEAKGY